MEIVTKEYKTYKFEELSKSVQEEVKQKIAQNELERDWWDADLECMIVDLDAMGISATEIYFDLYERNLYFGRDSRISNPKLFITYALEKRFGEGYANKWLIAQSMNTDVELNIDNVNLALVTGRNHNVLYVEDNGYKSLNDNNEEVGEISLEEQLGLNLQAVLEDIQSLLLNQLKESEEYISSDENILSIIEDRELRFLEDGEVFN